VSAPRRKREEVDLKIEESLSSVEIMALEMEPVVRMKPGVSVSQVIQKMRRKGLGYVLLTEERKLVGIFTQHDVLTKVLGRKEVLDRPVSEVMTPSPETIHRREPIRSAIKKMHDGGFHQIPIVDRSGKAVGCVRQKDVEAFLVGHFRDRVLNLPPDPGQKAKAPEGG
jgi:CBS domain-containing protein